MDSIIPLILMALFFSAPVHVAQFNTKFTVADDFFGFINGLEFHLPGRLTASQCDINPSR
jgi:hypothetical protein